MSEYQNAPALADGLVLDIHDLSIRFGGLKAVEALSFQVKEKEIFGLIGPNGAGKTTVFNCITQFYHPDRGQVLFRAAAARPWIWWAARSTRSSSWVWCAPSRTWRSSLSLIHI